MVSTATRSSCLTRDPCDVIDVRTALLALAGCPCHTQKKKINQLVNLFAWPLFIQHEENGGLIKSYNNGEWIHCNLTMDPVSHSAEEESPQ